MRLLLFKRFLPAAVLLFSAASAQAQAGKAIPPPIYLYPNDAPGALGKTEADRPRMYAFLPKKRSTSATVLVIPGGGYGVVAMGHEGFQVATWLNQQGIPAFVLDYRVSPYRYPVEIDDGRRAMRLIRAHAAEYGVDPTRIVVMGFSAGGHLASSLLTHCGDDSLPKEKIDADDSVSCQPNFGVLGYPVISLAAPLAHQGTLHNLLGADPDPKLVQDYSNQNAVTSKTPPTFLFATTNDPGVPVENSVEFYTALVHAHGKAELHLFDYANHGCGLCGGILPLQVWPGLLRRWMIDHSLLPPDAPPLPAPEPNSAVWPQGLIGPGKPPQ